MNAPVLEFRGVTKAFGERDVLREQVEESGMAVNVWLVLLHNTRLGMALALPPRVILTGTALLAVGFAYRWTRRGLCRNLPRP